MEFKEYADERAFLVDNSKTENTAKIYGRAYDKLVINIGDKPVLVSNADEDFLIATIKETSDNAETRATLLTIVFKLRADKKNPKLETYRELNKKDRAKNVIRRQAIEREKFQAIQYPNLVEFLDDLYRKKKYDDWIVNFLLINYGVRNADVNVILTKTRPTDDTKNWLWLVNGSRVDYIRNNYKTAKTYGQLTIQIRNKRFVKVIQEVMHNRTEDYKLMGDVTDASLSQKVIRITPFRLGEGQIFKIVVGHYVKMGKDLADLAKWRGTSVPTIIAAYHRETDDENAESLM